jgi:hypothetical protein
MPHDVIITYATIDKPIADAVCAKLEERGIRCWIAPRDILAGMNNAEAIISGIDNAKLMVLILSSHANASKNVMREAERAVHNGFPIIPFRIEDVQPNPSLQYYISAQHWLDALTPPLEQHILKLAETVSVLLNKSIPPPTQGIQPQPPGPSPPSTTRRPPRRTLVLSAVIVLVVISVIAAAYYGTQQGPTSSSSIWPPGTTTVSGNMVTYQNPTVGLKFTYPQNWTVNTVREEAREANNSGCFYVLSPPYSGGGTTFECYRYDRYAYGGDNDTAILTNKMNYDVASYKQVISNFTLLQNASPTIIAGQPAYKYTYSGYHINNPAATTMSMQIAILKGDYIYFFDYGGPASNFNRTLSTAELIVNSSEFLI